MGIVKQYSRTVSDAGRIDDVQTTTSTGELTNYGVSAVESAGGTFTLADPVKGVRKDIVDTGSTASKVVVSGTTYGLPVALVGLSTSSWAVISGSTA